MCCIVDLSILITPALRLMEEGFKSVIQKGPTCFCDICWKFEFRRNFIKLKKQKVAFIMNALLANQM